MPSIRRLTAADIPDAMRLTGAAGWNQTAADWQTLLNLAPDTCFGLESDGAIAATTTAVCYQERLAWIGMVLTDPAQRRHGFARVLMEHALDAVVARGIHWIKLDATDMGAPLYRQLGFADESSVERWRGTAASAPVGATHAWRDLHASLDRAAFGSDRASLLETLAATGTVALDSTGFAMARPGSDAGYLGPCVCRSADVAGRLIDAVLGRYAGQPVYWDLLADNRDAVRLARARAFEPVRRLVRMVRPGISGAEPLAHDDSRIFALAGFEYG